MTEEERRAHDTPGRRELDQSPHVVVDRFTNGAGTKLRRITQVMVACLIAFLIAVPSVIWAASRWTARMEDALELVAFRDSAMLAEIMYVREDVASHREEDASRDQELAEAVVETSKTVVGVVAVQRDLQDEVRRLRDRVDQ